MLSAGLKKDLLVVNFAHAILETAQRSDVIGREVIPNSKERNKIMRRCEALKKKCNDIFQSNMIPLTEKWFRSNLNSRILPALVKAEKENPQLETFAIYVLYINFLDGRKKKVDDMFKPILEAEKGLFDTLDLIEKSMGREVSEMYELAISTISIIKR